MSADEKYECGECVLTKGKCTTHSKKYKKPFTLFEARPISPDAYSFTLNKWQSEMIGAWWKKHHGPRQGCPYRKPENQGAIGGVSTYEFTPTGIGTVMRVRCACGKGVDVTDYGSW